MNLDERGRVLRERFLAKGGVVYVACGKKPKQPREKPSKIYIQWPQCEPEIKRAPAWFQAPDAKQIPTVRIARTSKPSPLATGAAKTIVQKLSSTARLFVLHNVGQKEDGSAQASRRRGPHSTSLTYLSQREGDVY
jgi:hypothetical protein